MILIKDGRVIDPVRGTDDVLDLQIQGDRILKIGKYHRSEEYDEIIEAKGLIVAPGLVGADVGNGEAGNAGNAAKGGFTTIAERPAPSALPKAGDQEGQCLIEIAASAPSMKTSGERYQIIEGLKNGSITRIAADHLETALALGVTNLVHKGHLTLMELIEKMSVNPAVYYGLDRKTIAEGARADLVIFSDTEKWKPEAGSPYEGTELYGKVHVTISAGAILYQSIDSI